MYGVVLHLWWLRSRILANTFHLLECDVLHAGVIDYMAVWVVNTERQRVTNNSQRSDPSK
jgi:hypothetical protein